uniref:Uncharacterized protein n=1 Tax=Panagrolaimus davidi TaxID=227884 RepID=A0A914QBR1_9BILA
MSDKKDKKRTAKEIKNIAADKQKENEKAKADAFKPDLAICCPHPDVIPDADAKKKFKCRQNHLASSTFGFVREILLKCGFNNDTDKLAYDIGMATFGCSIADKSKVPAGISFKYRASSAGRKVVTAAEVTLQSNDWCLDEENVEALVKAYEESSAMPNGFLKHLNELGSSNQAPFAKSFGFAATYFGFTKGLIENIFDDEMVKELKKCWKVMLQFGFGGLYQSFFSPVVVNKLHNNPEEKITVVGEPQIWTPKEHKPQPFTDEEKKKYGADVVNNARFLLNSVELLAAEGAGDAIRQTAFDVAKSQTLLMDLVLKKNKKSFDDCKAQFDLKSHRELHKMVHRFFDGDNLKHGELFKKQIVNRYKLYHFFNVSVRDELKKCLDKVVAVAEANKENVGQTVGAVSAGAATAVAETAGSAKSDIAEPAANKSDPAAGKEGALVISDEDETPKTDDGNKENVDELVKKFHKLNGDVEEAHKISNEAFSVASMSDS